MINIKGVTIVKNNEDGKNGVIKPQYHYRAALWLCSVGMGISRIAFVRLGREDYKQ